MKESQENLDSSESSKTISAPESPVTTFMTPKTISVSDNDSFESFYARIKEKAQIARKQIETERFLLNLQDAQNDLNPNKEMTNTLERSENISVKEFPFMYHDYVQSLLNILAIESILTTRDKIIFAAAKYKILFDKFYIWYQEKNLETLNNLKLHSRNVADYLSKLKEEYNSLNQMYTKSHYAVIMARKICKDLNIKIPNLSDYTIDNEYTPPPSHCVSIISTINCKYLPLPNHQKSNFHNNITKDDNFFELTIPDKKNELFTEVSNKILTIFECSPATQKRIYGKVLKLVEEHLNILYGEAFQVDEAVIAEQEDEINTLLKNCKTIKDSATFLFKNWSHNLTEMNLLLPKLTKDQHFNLINDYKKFFAHKKITPTKKNHNSDFNMEIKEKSNRRRKSL